MVIAVLRLLQTCTRDKEQPSLPTFVWMRKIGGNQQDFVYGEGTASMLHFQLTVLFNINFLKRAAGSAPSWSGQVDGHALEQPQAQFWGNTFRDKGNGISSPPGQLCSGCVPLSYQLGLKLHYLTA